MFSVSPFTEGGIAFESSNARTYGSYHAEPTCETSCLKALAKIFAASAKVTGCSGLKRPSSYPETMPSFFASHTYFAYHWLVTSGKHFFPQSSAVLFLPSRTIFRVPRG